MNYERNSKRTNKRNKQNKRKGVDMNTTEQEIKNELLRHIADLQNLSYLYGMKRITKETYYKKNDKHYKKIQEIIIILEKGEFINE